MGRLALIKPFKDEVISKSSGIISPQFQKWLDILYKALSGDVDIDGNLTVDGDFAFIDKSHWPKLTQGTDADHDIDLSAGVIPNSTGQYLMTLSAMTKRIDAAWAAGTGQGGLFTGSVANTTTYHFFIIKNPSTGAVDAGWDTSLTAANKPSGYTLYRRIWSFFSDGSANLRPLVFWGDYAEYKDPPLDINASEDTTANLRALAVPGDIRVRAIFNLVVAESGQEINFYVSCPDVNDEAASTSAAPLCTYTVLAAGVAVTNTGNRMEMMTNTSRQIRTIAQTTLNSLHISTLGYVDQRID